MLTMGNMLWLFTHFYLTRRHGMHVTKNFISGAVILEFPLRWLQSKVPILSIRPVHAHIFQTILHSFDGSILHMFIYCLKRNDLFGSFSSFYDTVGASAVMMVSIKPCFWFCISHENLKKAFSNSGKMVKNNDFVSNFPFLNKQISLWNINVSLFGIHMSLIVFIKTFCFCTSPFWITFLFYQ